MDETFWTVLRVINCVFCGIGLVGMVVRFRMWQRQALVVRLFGLGLGGLTVATLYATIESLFRSVPSGPRILVVTIPLFWLAVASFWPSRSKRRREP